MLLLFGIVCLPARLDLLEKRECDSQVEDEYIPKVLKNGDLRNGMWHGARLHLHLEFDRECAYLKPLHSLPQSPTILLKVVVSIATNLSC